MKKVNVKITLVLVIEGILLLLLLFANWLGIHLGWESAYTSLWCVGRIVSEVSYYTDSNAVAVLLCIFLYGGLAASLAAIGFTCVSAWKPIKGRTLDRALFGLYVPAGYSVLMMLLVVLANAIVKSETSGWVESVFALSATPFIALVLEVGGIMGYKKIPDRAFDIAGKTTSSFVTGIVGEKATCPKCGARSKAGAMYCSDCGERIPMPVKPICKNCGTKLDAQAKFCSACGTPVAETVETADSEEQKASGRA